MTTLDLILRLAWVPWMAIALWEMSRTRYFKKERDEWMELCLRWRACAKGEVQR